MSKSLLQNLVLWLVCGVVIYWLDPVIPGFKVTSLWSSLEAFAIIFLVNALVWPVLVGLLTRFNLWLFLGLVVLLNGGIINLVGLILQGIEVNNPGSGFLLVLVLTLIITLLSYFLSFESDYYYIYWINNLVLKRKHARHRPQTEPSIAFVEIDGCSGPVLQAALDRDLMPTLKRWLATGSHKLAEWDCDLGTQTCASQAGILHGTNSNIPAYRWYDKKERRIYSASQPQDMAVVQRRISNGLGLLSRDGSSRVTLFSGDAADTLITASTLLEPSRNRSEDYYAFFADPYNFMRTLILFGRELVIETVAAWWQRHKKVRPRGPRGGYYPLVRAFASVVLRELSVYTLMLDILRGRKVTYTSFLGYDEVAHHSGLVAPDALAVLANLDKQLARLEKISRRSPNPVKFVVLSDHGQSQGATFKQRTGRSLAELVDFLLQPDQKVLAHVPPNESWDYLNTFLGEARHATHEQVHIQRHIGPNRPAKDKGGLRLVGPEKANLRYFSPDKVAAEAIVLASGNLGLVYFTSDTERMSLEQISRWYPGLLEGLARQPFIGFIMVRSEKFGPVALGASGTNFINQGRCEGENPLQNFGPHTADALGRLDTFSNAPDILVNSFYDPAQDEVAAFEELISCHGGLGGLQTRPFILYPAEFNLPEGEIRGAEKLYQIFKAWLAEPGADRLSAADADTELKVGKPG